jgi:long-subunit acyl-CoA synthetase (AMP-forming)
MRKSVLAAVRRTPAAQPALGDGVRRVSYGDLNKMIEQERRWLDSFVVRDCALIAENSCGWVISDLALLSCDAVSVSIPINFTAEQVGYALHDSAVEFVLTEAGLRTCAEQAGFAKVGLSNRTGLTLLHRRGTYAAMELPAEVSKISYRAQGMSNPHAMLFDAGTIKQAASQLLQAQQRKGITKHLSFLPLTTMLENIGGVHVPLLLGAQVVLKTRAIAAMSCTPTGIETLLQTLRQEQPHSVALTATLLGALLNAIDRGWQPPQELRSVVVDGQSASSELLQRAHTAGLPITPWELMEWQGNELDDLQDPTKHSVLASRALAVPDRSESAFGAAG